MGNSSRVIENQSWPLWLDASVDPPRQSRSQGGWWSLKKGRACLCVCLWSQHTPDVEDSKQQLFIGKGCRAVHHILRWNRSFQNSPTLTTWPALLIFVFCFVFLLAYLSVPPVYWHTMLCKRFYFLLSLFNYFYLAPLSVISFPLFIWVFLPLSPGLFCY